MKVRTGFVSNSSSSSFVIGLPAPPTSKRELHHLLFGDLTERFLAPDWADKAKAENNEKFQVSSRVIVENIFNQIMDQEPVDNDMLSKLSSPEHYPNYVNADTVPEGRTINRQMTDRYGVEYPYALSPTNKLMKKQRAIQLKLDKAYNTEMAKQSKARWAKLAPRFKGLKKYVIMTQTDGGKEGRVLAFLEYCWDDIFKNVTSVKLHSH